MAMKYKVGDKVMLVRLTGTVNEVIKGRNDSYLYRVVGDDGLGNFNAYESELNPYQETKNHEDTILHLNELNTIKTRQIEDLMKFIAQLTQEDYTYANDINQSLELQVRDLKDVQLVNGIMYHIRKGK